MTELMLDKVHLHGGRAAATKRRALRRLERASPIQPGAPSEVLIVRRLSDPAPGALGRAVGEKGLGSWEQALSGALDTVRARALRPAPGVSLAGAEAVVFRDEAEMYACLAECLAGGVTRVWWTQALLRRIPPGSGTEAVLRQQLHLVPAMTEVLVLRNSIHEVFSTLPASAALELARDLGLVGAGRHARPSTASPTHDVVGQAEQVLAGAVLSDAPAALRDSIASLPTAQAKMLSIAWVRRKRPGLAGPSLTAAAEILRRAARTRQVPQRAESSRDAGQPRDVQDGSSKDRAPAPGSSNHQSRAPLDPPNAGAADRGHEIDRRAKDPQSPEPAPQPVGASRERPPDTATGPDRETPEKSARETEADAVIVTELGGIFFLINVFTTEFAARNPALSDALKSARRPEDGPWTRLEKLARALLGRIADPTMHDPIWGLLAALDGRPAETPAAPAKPDQIAARRLRAWLTRAAWGLDGPPEGQSPEGLLRRRARIFVAPMHIDVILPASAQRLPVRRAGLDLDPGWQPAFGRIVAFHYREHEVI